MIVIVGAGEVGFHIANHLTLDNKEVVVIDKNADARSLPHTPSSVSRR